MQGFSRCSLCMHCSLSSRAGAGSEFLGLLFFQLLAFPRSQLLPYRPEPMPCLSHGIVFMTKLGHCKISFEAFKVLYEREIQHQ